MTRRVVVRRLARVDIDHACKFYEEKALGLGGRFAAHIDSALARLIESPFQYPTVHRDMRRVVLLPFPYALFYKVDAETIRVFAVVHTSRDPRIWQRRA